MVPRHPTQLYETAFHLAAAAFGCLYQRRGWFVGNQIKLYIFAYAVCRLASEMIRPEARICGGLTGHQLASVMIAGLVVVLRQPSSTGVRSNA